MKTRPLAKLPCSLTACRESSSGRGRQNPEMAPPLQHLMIGGVECRWASTARRAAADRGEGGLLARLTKVVVQSASAGELDEPPRLPRSNRCLTRRGYVGMEVICGGVPEFIQERHRDTHGQTQRCLVVGGERLKQFGQVVALCLPELCP
jgi:hypothetical protein